MEYFEFKRFKDVLESVVEQVDEEDCSSINIKERLYRIINEVEFCVTYDDRRRYLPLQQFRILMDKIINVILLRDKGEPYYKYLNMLEEYEVLYTRREFLERRILSKSMANDRECFLEKSLKYNNIDKKSIREFKHHKFYYWMGYLSNDSSRLIHDDNSTYKKRISNEILEEIEQIILFFISNIFISFCNDEYNKEYLRNIHRRNKKKIRNNSSISKKNIKKIKKEIRGVA
ncbi:hypothetical protein RWZ02_15730 [Clostridium butyricum]|uniref:hypothetical protein n=1 Tax=Clostridium butyricum TaxID=1492 RepID=UPI0028FD9ECF|nr:hypothetical protein [Clostridium butyricum]MDU0324124.1 hypothetical protein [Clostridium butyricum]